MSMATKKKDKAAKNGGAPAEYQWKPGMGVGARVRFERDTHEFMVDKSFNAKEGVIVSTRIDSEDGMPEAELRLDGGKGVAMVHPDDCTILLAAGAERAELTEATVAELQGQPLPKEPFDMGEVVHECAVPLADEVLIAKGKELAGLELEEEPIKARVEREKDLAKNELAGIAARRSKLQTELRDGTERKDIKCKWIGDPTHMVKRLVRTDLDPTDPKAIVEERVLSLQECQAAFPEPGFAEPLKADEGDDDITDEEPERELGGDDAGESASASAH
jgi:hypothetical protein